MSLKKILIDTVAEKAHSLSKRKISAREKFVVRENFSYVRKLFFVRQLFSLFLQECIHVFGRYFESI